MNKLALALAVVTCGAALSLPAVAGDDVPKPAAPQELVGAAKAAKAKRKSSTTKVITNADVKKAKGKVVEHKLAPLPVDAASNETLTERQARLKKESADYAAKLDAAEKAVRGLEAELAAIEQKYYDENDLNRRDGELVKRFNDTKKKLDAARAELAAFLAAGLSTQPPIETAN